MITIVLMFTISWPGNGELGALSALCLDYNFLFRGLNLSQCPGRGSKEQAQDDCESVARSIVSVSGVRRYYFRLLRIVVVKWHSLQLLKLSSFSITRRTKPIEEKLLQRILPTKTTIFYELIILTCNNCTAFPLCSLQFEALLMLPFFPDFKCVCVSK